MNKLAPSILASDFSNLKNEIKVIEQAGADYLHIDVMDGHFVNNITFGLPVIECIRPHSNIIFDVHLMIENPHYYIDRFKEAGADIINVHIEAVNDLNSVVTQIKKSGAKAAVTIKPATAVDCIIQYLDIIDMVLVMSVDPGFGGQSLIPQTLKKIEYLADLKQKNGLKYDIEIDGGVTIHNLKTVLNAGANVIVAGSSIFHKNDLEKTMDAVINFKKIMNT